MTKFPLIVLVFCTLLAWYEGRLKAREARRIAYRARERERHRLRQKNRTPAQIERDRERGQLYRLRTRDEQRVRVHEHWMTRRRFTRDKSARNEMDREKRRVNREARERLALILVGRSEPLYIPQRVKIMSSGERVLNRRRNQNRATARLDRTYVIRKIRRQTGLPARTIPDAMVEAKRVHLRLHRATRARAITGGLP